MPPVWDGCPNGEYRLGCEDCLCCMSSPLAKLLTIQCLALAAAGRAVLILIVFSMELG